MTPRQHAQERACGLLDRDDCHRNRSATVILFLIRTPHLEWPIVGNSLFSSVILRGVGTTLEVAAICFVVSTIIGTIVAALRTGPFRPLGGVAAAYSVLCRSVPLLVALLFWFNLAYLTPTLSIGVPFGPVFQYLEDQQRCHSVWRRDNRSQHLPGCLHLRDHSRGPALSGPGAARRRAGSGPDAHVDVLEDPVAAGSAGHHSSSGKPSDSPSARDFACQRYRTVRSPLFSKEQFTMPTFSPSRCSSWPPWCGISL